MDRLIRMCIRESLYLKTKCTTHRYSTIVLSELISFAVWFYVKTKNSVLWYVNLTVFTQLARLSLNWRCTTLNPDSSKTSSKQGQKHILLDSCRRTMLLNLQTSLTSSRKLGSKSLKTVWRKLRSTLTEMVSVNLLKSLTKNGSRTLWRQRWFANMKVHGTASSD